jgi:hypothetical protein
MILLISASQIARITGMSHQHLALLLLKKPPEFNLGALP